MQNGNEVFEDIKEKRGVTFAGRLGEPGMVFIPYHQAIKKNLNHSRTAKNVLAYLSRGEYDKIDSYFQSKAYTPHDIECLYKNEGSLVFRWAIVAPNAEPLRYLAKTVSRDLIHDILSRDGFSVLNSFLGAQKIREDDNRATVESRSVAAEKLKIVLGVGDSAINEFIEKNPNRQAIRLTF